MSGSWRRCLDGGPSWGSLTVSLPRYGVTRYRLVVFPPGISVEERMLLRAWRTWPALGLSAFLLLEILLVPSIGPDVALEISAGVLLGSGAVLAAMTSALRSGVRALTATAMAGTDDAQGAARLAHLQALTRTLAAADRGLADGDIGCVEHELAVWDVYERLAADSRANT